MKCNFFTPLCADAEPINGNLIKQSNGLEFFYDHTGVFAVKYNNATYFYRKNAQNDIIALLDNTGTTVVKYKYDAWGMCKALNAEGFEITDNNHIGILNPFRYRSYYYDHGIGLYFLKTRYYDPQIGRFMTIDDISYLDPESINGLNLYAYCKNNPIMRVDPNGNFDWGTFIDIAIKIGAGIAGFAVGAFAGALTYKTSLQFGNGPITSMLASLGVGAVVGLATYRVINNTVNAFYYTFISSGESDLNNSSYKIGDSGYQYLNRWERLDYTKQKTGQTVYNFNAWMYYSEYNFHMHVWNNLSFLKLVNVFPFSWLAGKAASADVVANQPLYDLTELCKTGKPLKIAEGILRIIAYLAVGSLGV